MTNKKYLGSLKKIAVIMGTGIGDFVVMQPLLRKLKEAYPGAAITLISREFKNKELFALSKNFNDTAAITSGDILSRVKTLVNLRKENFDLVFVGYNAKASSTILSYLIGGKFRAGFAKSRLSFIYNLKLEKEGKVLPEINLNSLGQLGIKIGREDFELPMLGLKGIEPRIKEIFEENSIDEPPVVFHIGTKKGYFTRFWPKERWVALVNHLSNNYKLKIIFIGSLDDIKETEEVVRLSENKAINLVGQLSIKETARLISQCSLFISTNSGPMWLAAAFHKPQIALCGPSKFEWEPYNDRAIVIRKSIERKHCNPPCDEKICRYGDNLCMESINAKEVIDFITEMLEK